MADRRDRDIKILKREDNEKEAKLEKDKDIRGDTRQDLRKEFPRGKRDEGGFGGRRDNDQQRRFGNNDPYPRGQFNPNKRRNDRNQFRVDRKKVCPFLLRVFPETGKHHELTEYTPASVPTGEIAIYTWKDTSLRELSELILPALKLEKDSASLKFSLVYSEPSGELAMRPVGSIAKNQGPDDQKTFVDFQFTTGDYLDVCVTPNPVLTKVA